MACTWNRLSSSLSFDISERLRSSSVISRIRYLSVCSYSPRYFLTYRSVLVGLLVAMSVSFFWRSATSSVLCANSFLKVDIVWSLSKTSSEYLLIVCLSVSVFFSYNSSSCFQWFWLVARKYCYFSLLRAANSFSSSWVFTPNSYTFCRSSSTSNIETYCSDSDLICERNKSSRWLSYSLGLVENMQSICSFDRSC